MVFTTVPAILNKTEVISISFAIDLEMEPSTSSNREKRKRKSLFNGEDVANLLMNEFSDDEHYYESSGSEYELPKRKKKGRKKGAR